MKKGFKDFFFERTDEQIEDAYDVYNDCSPDENVDVETSDVTQERLIEDVYESNELSDKTRSIFKVEEVLQSLPKEMPNETKRSTLLAILGSFGLTVDEVLEDGEKRISIVKAAMNKISDENEAVIAENLANIEQKKVEIQDLEKDNANRLEIVDSTESKINVEVERIDSLIKFVKGE